MAKVLKRPAGQGLKRPAASDSGPPSKRLAAAILEMAGLELAPRAPLYLPSKRPKPEKPSGNETKEPPKSQRMYVKDASFKQCSLKALKNRMPPLLKLHLCGGGINKPAVLDFTVAGFALPELRDLVVQNWPIKRGVFEQHVFPSLKSLEICFPFDGEPGTPDDWDGFKVALPELTDLVLEHPGSVKTAELKASTQACPKLSYFCLYKVYVENLSIVLPNAEIVWLHRMEFLKSVSVYGPRLKELRLQACYDLKRVNILKLAPGVAPNEQPMTKFAVDLTNSGLPRPSIDEIREHPRVKYVVSPSDEDSVSEDEEELQSSTGRTFKIGHFMKPPGMNRMQLDGLLGLARFGEEIGVDVCEKVHESRSIKVEHMARILEWGAQVVYVWYDVQVSDEALALARRAKLPLKFWDTITAKKTNSEGPMPIISMVNDMRRCIKNACT